jgi:basic amino acid/polyamine antiporter, APA family
MSNISEEIHSESVELRRDVSVWGSYMWGFADVGADSFVALGLVLAVAQGAGSLAFALAGLVYIMIGLAYTELASAYPVAGGGHYFALRGLGDFWGFVAGSALLLDYTIDIALFTVASAGYFNFFFPYFFGIDINHFQINFWIFKKINWLWGLESVALICYLIWLNIKGIRESSLLNEIVGAGVIFTESAIIIIGFLFAWKPELFMQQWNFTFAHFELHKFMYGTSLAIISFVGLESISQAAQETRRPATIVPRTSIALIFSVFIFATAFATLSLGVLPWQEFAKHIDNPVAQLAKVLPFIGLAAGPFTALLGSFLLLISANSGVMSASRLSFSMSELHILSTWFDQVHPKYKTPVRAILVFSVIGMIQTVLSFLTPSAMDTLGNMYAFGATLGYTIVFISLIRLRFVDPYTPRPYKVPFNIKVKSHNKVVDFPVLGIIGTLGVMTILYMVVLTHEIGRIAGPSWVILCFIYYAWFRKSQGLPVWGSVKHDWEAEQRKVLESAEEYDLLEEYRYALLERDKKLKKQNGVNGNGTKPL